MVKEKSRIKIINIILAVIIAALLLVMLYIYFNSAEKEPQGPGTSVIEEPNLHTDPDLGLIVLPDWPELPKNELDADKFYAESGLLKYPGSFCGVDVSIWQGEIDWELIRDAGIDFAIVQLGYRGYLGGTLNLDEWYIENMGRAAAVGLDIGIYFFSQAVTVEEAIEEAEFVIEALEGMDIAYPVFFDWEQAEGETRTSGVRIEEVTEFALAFCGLIEDNGYTAGIYFNRRQVYTGYDLSRLAGFEFWLAEYNETPSFYYAFDIWQYSAEGILPGVAGTIDLNISFKDYRK